MHTYTYMHCQSVVTVDRKKGSEERKGNDGAVSPASALWCCTLTQLSKIVCVRTHLFYLGGFAFFFALNRKFMRESESSAPQPGPRGSAYTGGGGMCLPGGCSRTRTKQSIAEQSTTITTQPLLMTRYVCGFTFPVHLLHVLLAPFSYARTRRVKPGGQFRWCTADLVEHDQLFGFIFIINFSTDTGKSDNVVMMRL